MAKIDKEKNKDGYIRTIETTFDENDNVIESKEIITPRSPSSMEFSMDSKGNVKPQVKVYHEDPAKALEIAKKLMSQAVQYANKQSIDN